MHALQSRLDSFTKKRKKWPHPITFIATPNSLACAGFYFNPTVTNKDNVTCYLCNKQLYDWDSQDDPDKVHIQKSINCPWAILKCNDLPPIHDQQSRLATFIHWPHASPSHGANPTNVCFYLYFFFGTHFIFYQMARAGFVYTPQLPGDDVATCIHCDIALSGWDDDDDPIEEHKKRERKAQKPCPFLSAISEPTKTTDQDVDEPVVKKPKKKAKAVVTDVETTTDQDVEEPVKKPKRKARAKKVVQEEGDAETVQVVQADPVKKPKRKARAKKVVQEVEDVTMRAETVQEVQVPEPDPEPVQEPVPEPEPEQIISTLSTSALTEPELDMTVEQWVRAEIAREHAQFRSDGERAMKSFKDRADEVRKIIEMA